MKFKNSISNKNWHLIQNRISIFQLMINNVQKYAWIVVVNALILRITVQNVVIPPNKYLFVHAQGDSILKMRLQIVLIVS